MTTTPLKGKAVLLLSALCVSRELSLAVICQHGTSGNLSQVNEEWIASRLTRRKGNPNDLRLIGNATRLGYPPTTGMLARR